MGLDGDGGHLIHLDSPKMGIGDTLSIQHLTQLILWNMTRMVDKSEDKHFVCCITDQQRACSLE